MRLTFLLFLLGGFGTAHAGWFGPKNYDECILENMKGVTLKQAVRVIQNSCRAKFPEACYAWQKARDAKLRDKNPGIFDDLDKKYGINQPSSTNKPWEKYASQPNPEFASSYEDGAPDGCREVLRAYSTETGQSVHGKVDSRSVATRGFVFTLNSVFASNYFCVGVQTWRRCGQS